MTADALAELREKVAQALFNDTFGGTSDPTLTEMHEALCLQMADAAIALIRPAALRDASKELAALGYECEGYCAAHLLHLAEQEGRAAERAPGGTTP